MISFLCYKTFLLVGQVIQLLSYDMYYYIMVTFDQRSIWLNLNCNNVCGPSFNTIMILNSIEMENATIH